MPDRLPPVGVREAFKVRGLVPGGAGGVAKGPETDGLAGEGARTDEVPGLAGRCDVHAGVRVERADCHAQAGGLHGTGLDGEERVACAEEGDDVRAAGDGGEVHVRTEGGGLVDVTEGAGGERGCGVEDGAERGGGEGEGVRGGLWVQGFLLEHREVLCAGAEVVDGELIDEAGHGEVVRVGLVPHWGAVVED